MLAPPTQYIQYVTCTSAVVDRGAAGASSTSSRISPSNISALKAAGQPLANDTTKWLPTCE
jgi:hypothetical protein